MDSVSAWILLGGWGLSSYLNTGETEASQLLSVEDASAVKD